MPFVKKVRSALGRAKRLDDQTLKIRRSRATGDLDRLNELRWDAARTSLKAFCVTYMPEVFAWEFGPAHLTAIDKAEKAVLSGGMFALAMPRGSGKTCNCEAAAIWAILYGYRRYAMLIAATNPKAEMMMDDIKQFVRRPGALHEDFPEVEAFATLDNVGFRCRALQLEDKKPSGAIWRTRRVVFPSVPDAPNCGGVVESVGLTGDIRGRKHTMSDGSVVRPDLVLIDDPQTLESASSPMQTDDREAIIRKDILGLAGPGQRLAALMPCTVIRRGDLAERLLDTDRNPDWQGERTSMFVEWPRHLKAWENYNEVRVEGVRVGDGGAAANAYYLAHRQNLDAGAVVSWEARRDKMDISAVQTAMNLYFKIGKDAFCSEYQNQPLDTDVSLTNLTPAIVASRTNGLRPGEVRKEALYVVGMADINRVGFHWAICAFRHDLTGDVVNYGRWPGNGEPLWRENEEDPDTACFRRLTQFVPWLTREVRLYQNDQPRQLDWLSVDCGYLTGTVIRALAELNRGAPCPIRPGRGYSSRHYRLPPKDRQIANGENWDLRKLQDAPTLAHNADVLRRDMMQSFMLPVGSPGSLSVFGDDATMHLPFAEHVCANQLKRFVKGDDGRYDMYDWQQTGHDDWCDAVVGCTAAAMRLGAVRGASADPAGKAGAPKSRASKGAKIRVSYQEV
jgi:hypothetical protein